MKKITQTKNTVYGPLVGGDYIAPGPTMIDVLNQQYLLEKEQDAKTIEFIDELMHYRSKKSEVRDLKEKLTAAGFEHLIEEGEELKDLVARLIVKYQYYKSAQKIVAFILSDVESLFRAKIKPKLNCSKQEHEFHQLVHEFLECEIQKKLGSNVLEIFNRQIRGMMYFLTGNCHLEWG